MSPTFLELGVPARLCDRLSARSIEEAFPIQEVSIPDALDGRDVVGKAATGSGKTLAFGLPVMALTQGSRPRRPGALILVPTRELAAQVQKELAQLTTDRGRRILAIYGGTPYHTARKALQAGVDVVVACPGRLEDMLSQNALDLGDVRMVVIDEADRMADMGFLPSVRRIVEETHPERQTLLFSATMGPDVRSLIDTFTHDAAHHDVVGEEAPSDVDHFFWKVPRDRRPDFCAEIVERYERAIVFTRTKHGADRLARQLGERGFSAVALHGDRSQAQRERALRAVKSGQSQVLVATDVAARGIHIDLLPVVIHYDPPTQATDYLHRSGRTGRAGATGAVISLVSDDTAGHVKRLQRALGLTPTIHEPEEAQPIRLGAVNDADAAERLDDTPTRSAKPVPRGRVERSESKFERRERPARAERGERAESRFERRERPARAERSERPEPRFERRERPARAERSFRDERPARDERPVRERATRPERPSAQRERNRPFADARPGRTERPHSRAPRSTQGEAVVSFFHAKKGFGFASDGQGEDLFIHFSQIMGSGFKSLNEGQRITFEEARGPKGREARNVRPLDSRPSRR